MMFGGLVAAMILLMLGVVAFGVVTVILHVVPEQFTATLDGGTVKFEAAIMPLVRLVI